MTTGITCCFIDEDAKQVAEETLPYIKVHLLPPAATFDDEAALLGDMTMIIGGCQAPAEWEIWYGDTSDDNTLACSAHVGELLHPGNINRVSRFYYEGEQS